MSGLKDISDSSKHAKTSIRVLKEMSVHKLNIIASAYGKIIVFCGSYFYGFREYECQRKMIQLLNIHEHMHLKTTNQLPVKMLFSGYHEIRCQRKSMMSQYFWFTFCKKKTEIECVLHKIRCKISNGEHVFNG